MSLKLNTGDSDSMVKTKMSPRSMNIQAKPLLGPPLGKGETAPTRRHQVGSLEQKKGASFIGSCRVGWGLGIVIGFRCTSACGGP